MIGDVFTQKEPLRVLFVLHNEPDSVPILPTAGGCRIENPEFIEGLPLDFARDARFCNCLRQAKLATVMHLG